MNKKNFLLSLGLTLMAVGVFIGLSVVFAAPNWQHSSSAYLDRVFEVVLFIFPVFFLPGAWLYLANRE